MDNFNQHIDQVTAPLANGYLTPADAFKRLTSQGVELDVAFFVVKGAIVLNKARSARS